MATVGYDPDTELLAVTDIGQASRHPLVAAFVRQNAGRVDDVGRVTIPTSGTDLASRYQALKRVLGRVGISIETEGHVSDVLERVESEERRFTEFSRQAHEIWNADIDTEAFRSFVDTVSRKCVGRTFYRKQLLSAFHLAFSLNACNFSVPGAGKTSIVYAAYAYLNSLPPSDDRYVDKLLIVGPPSSFKAWEDEYTSIFSRKAISRRISGVTAVEERFDHLHGISAASRSTELTLTTYQTLSNGEDDFRVFLKHVAPSAMMVLDEAHNIKNTDGVQAASALRLSPLAKSRVVLTGTPAPNGYEDLSNLFKFIYPSKDVIGFPVSSLRAMSDGGMPRAVPELKTKIQPFYTRIRKVDLGLPPADDRRVAVPMSELHSQIYRGLETRIVPQLRMHLDDSQGAVRLRARLIRLRQAAVNPELLLRPLEQDEGLFDTGGGGDLSVDELEVAAQIRAFVADQDLLRLAICRQLVRDILRSQQRVLIWSYFLGNLDLLRHSLIAEAPFLELLTGATPVSGGDSEYPPDIGTREEIIDRFHSTSGPAILIANPQAVGESISLHKACRTAIYFDRDFNAGRFIQSKDRIHRYNPEAAAPVSYYFLVSEGTVDQDIDLRLVTKEARMSDLVDASDIPLFTASDDGDLGDLRAILDAYELRKTQ